MAQAPRPALSEAAGCGTMPFSAAGAFAPAPAPPTLSTGAEAVSALTRATTASAPYTPEKVRRMLDCMTGRIHSAATVTTARATNTHLSTDRLDSTRPSTNSTGNTPHSITHSRIAGSKGFFCGGRWGCCGP